MIIAQLHRTCPATMVTIWLLLCFRTKDEILLDNAGHVWRDKLTAIIATIVTTPPHTHTVSGLVTHTYSDSPDLPTNLSRPSSLSFSYAQQPRDLDLDFRAAASDSTDPFTSLLSCCLGLRCQRVRSTHIPSQNKRPWRREEKIF